MEAAKASRTAKRRSVLLSCDVSKYKLLGLQVFINRKGANKFRKCFFKLLKFTTKCQAAILIVAALLIAPTVQRGIKNQ